MHYWLMMTVEHSPRHHRRTVHAAARDETNLDALPAELVRVVRETLQPEHVSVWLLNHEEAK